MADWPRTVDSAGFETVATVNPTLALCAGLPDNGCDRSLLVCVGGWSPFDTAGMGDCNMLEDF